MSNPLLLISHPDCARHDTGPGHPERPERLTHLLQSLADSGISDRCRVERPEPASPDHIVLNHARAYYDIVARAGQSGPESLDGGDTIVMEHSFRAARLAVGAGLLACDRVVGGHAEKAVVLVRPPGHHAEFDHALGFCIFNNIAIAARYLQRQHGLEKIAIIDWDVHHGNGTQHAFYDDGSVFYFSIHQFPLFPGTGKREETGAGAGRGATMNVPVAAGTGDADYIRIFETQLAPALQQFAPDILLISAGFDAHRADPLGGMALTTDGFGQLTRIVRAWADDWCAGRVISLLEGGYDLHALADSVRAHIVELSP